MKLYTILRFKKTHYPHTISADIELPVVLVGEEEILDLLPLQKQQQQKLLYETVLVTKTANSLIEFSWATHKILLSQEALGQDLAEAIYVLLYGSMGQRFGGVDDVG